MGLHYDPKIFRNPGKWDPYRFSKEEKNNQNPYAFFGFGQGPRNCIGMRFTILEIKLTIIALIREFEILPNENTPKVTTFDRNSALGAAKEDLLVNFAPRN